VENILIFAFGAFCGIAIYRGLLVLYLVNISLNAFRMVELSCLQMLALTVEDATFVKETKLLVMQRTKSYNKNQIKITKNMDNQLMKIWKENSIKKMLSRYPKGMRQSARYGNWRTAMAWLELNKHKVLDK
tara:strand:+ start:222 stop:614 length:393 start_codon:yes stop_codon:yes gene_type:complete